MGLFSTLNTLLAVSRTISSSDEQRSTPMHHDIATQNDLIENPSPRCACTVILDTSYSMAGDRIRQLNQGLQLFLQEVHADEMTACTLEVSVITAGGKVREELPFTSALNIDSCQHFSANGSTPLGGAMDLALNNLSRRKAEYKKAGVPYYQPWVVMISDGGPNDSGWEQAAATAKQLSADGKLVSLTVGVEGADMADLGQFSHRPPVKLDGLKFTEFFMWLSASMARVSQSASTSASVELPPMDGWASI